MTTWINAGGEDKVFSEIRRAVQTARGFNRKPKRNAAIDGYCFRLHLRGGSKTRPMNFKIIADRVYDKFGKQITEKQVEHAIERVMQGRSFFTEAPFGYGPLEILGIDDDTNDPLHITGRVMSPSDFSMIRSLESIEKSILRELWKGTAKILLNTAKERGLHLSQSLELLEAPQTELNKFYRGK